FCKAIPGVARRPIMNCRGLRRLLTHRVDRSSHAGAPPTCPAAPCGIGFRLLDAGIPGTPPHLVAGAARLAMDKGSSGPVRGGGAGVRAVPVLLEPARAELALRPLLRPAAMPIARQSYGRALGHTSRSFRKRLADSCARRCTGRTPSTPGEILR